jgi:subtilase family protein
VIDHFIKLSRMNIRGKYSSGSYPVKTIINFNKLVLAFVCTFFFSTQFLYAVGPGDTIREKMKSHTTFAAGESSSQFFPNDEHSAFFEKVQEKLEDLVDQAEDFAEAFLHLFGRHNHDDENDVVEEEIEENDAVKDEIIEDVVADDEDPVEIIARPQTPTLRFDPELYTINRELSANEKAFLSACDMETRLGLGTPFARSIRSHNRLNPKTEGLLGAITYDDGSVEKDTIDKAFNGVIRILGDNNKLPFQLTPMQPNPYDCEAGNHATAVTTTMRQAFGSSNYPITVIGGDGRFGDYSDGSSIDPQYVQRAISDLQNKVNLSNPVVLNASYGFDGRGDYKDTLDEGGLWKALWDNVADSVVVQAAGNEDSDLSSTVDGELYESAYNMEYARTNGDLGNNNLWGRFIHAMASVPTQIEDSNNFTAGLADTFSNYYSYTKDSAFARDHSIMAPGDFVLIPLDPFDQDQDGDILEQGKMLTEWSGTSAAAPVITGCILRLVNEYGLTAKAAAAILLDTADLIYVDKTNGYLKNLNMGAALVALERTKSQKIAQFHADKSLVTKKSYVDTVLKAFFTERTTDLTVAETNYLLNIGHRLGILRSIASDQADFGEGKLYDLGMNEVAGYPSDGVYIYQVGNDDDLIDYRMVYLHNPDASFITSIQTTDIDGRYVTFRISYNKPTGRAKAEELDFKGIIDIIYKVNKVSDTAFDISVSVLEQYQSQRLFTLIPKEQIIAGAQNNQVFFDTDHFVE